MSVCYGLQAECAAHRRKISNTGRTAFDLTHVRQEHHQHDTWYTAIRFVTDLNSYMSCIMSTSCTGFLEAGQRSCTACGNMANGKHSLRSAMARTTYAGHPSKNLATYSVLRGRLNKTLLANYKLRQQNTARLSAAINEDNAFPACTTQSSLQEFVRRGHVQAVLRTLKDLTQETGGGNNKTCAVAMSVAVHIITNCVLPPNKRRGRLCSPETTQLCTAIRLSGGKTLYSKIAATLSLPHERCIRKKTKQCGRDVFFRHGMSEENFVSLGRVYTKAMNRLQLKLGSIVCSMAEDETAVIKECGYDQATDTFAGTCGDLCSKKCNTKKECKEAGCPDAHECVPHEAEPFIVGSSDTSFANMESFATHQKIAPYLRLVLINPHHYDLPRLPCLMVGTCLTFTAYKYILPQWRQLAEWYNKHLLPVIGPLIGRSSDGDSRRRKAFFERSIPRSPSQTDRYTIDTPSFTFSGIVTPHGILLDCDQDYKHNFKKLFNVTASSTKVLRLGPNTYNLSMLGVVVQAFHVSEHGLLPGDLVRTGWAAMDVPSAQRACSEKVDGCLEKLIRGHGDMDPQPMLNGLRRHLCVTRRYLSIFYDHSQTIEDRIVSCAYVANYLRTWRLWCRHTEGLSVKKNFITEEGFRDVLLSVHFVVLLIRVYSEQHPAANIPFDLLGTDPCEDYFSGLGNWVANKRTYTTCEAVQTTRGKLILALIAADGSVFPNLKIRHRHLNLDGESTVLPPQIVLPEAKPDHARIIVLWATGTTESRNHLWKDGMRPQQVRGTYPVWWTHPETYDPKQCPLSQSEEELLEGNVQDNDLHRPDDEKDDRPPDDDHYSDGNDDNEDKKDDDDQEFLEEGKNQVDDRNGAIYEANPDSADNTSDNVPLLTQEQERNRRRNHEGENDSECTTSDDTPILTREQERNRRWEPGGDGEAGHPPHEVLDEALNTILVNGADPKINPSVYVPFLQKEVSKLRVCKWLNDGRGKISPDREIRVRSAHRLNAHSGNQNDPEFNLAQHDWKIGLFSDIAVWMEATENQERDTLSIGRVIRMRKKNGTRFTTYQRPVVLHKNRALLGELYFTMYWYKRINGGGGREKRFRLNSQTYQEVHVKSLICPAKLEYNTANKYFVLHKQADDVMHRQLRGELEWEGA